MITHLRPHTRPQQPARRGRDDRGSVTVESVILFPVVLLIIFGSIQAGLYYYGRSIASAAAEQGLQAARAEKGTAGDGATRAQDFLTTSSKGILTDTAVRPARDAVTATITVTGQTPSLVPGMTFTVSQSASGTVERITTRGGGTTMAAAP